MEWAGLVRLVETWTVGEISVDGKTIEGRWERGMEDAGDEWEIDFPINYVRK